VVGGEFVAAMAIGCAVAAAPPRFACRSVTGRTGPSREPAIHAALGDSFPAVASILRAACRRGLRTVHALGLSDSEPAICSHTRPPSVDCRLPAPGPAQRAVSALYEHAPPSDSRTAVAPDAPATLRPTRHISDAAMTSVPLSILAAAIGGRVMGW